MLHLQNWMDDKYVDTPYWISFKIIADKGWKLPESFLGKVSQIKHSRKVVTNSINLAIDVPCGVLEDDAVEAIKQQIVEYMRLFKD